MTGAWRRAAVVAALRLAVALAVAAAAWSALSAVGAGTRPGWWALVTVTVAVALALRLVRDRVDRLADRIVFGPQADGYAVMQQLLQRWAGAVPVDEVLPRLAEAAGRGRRRAEVRLRLADGAQWSQVWPPQASPTGASVRVDVVHQGQAVGEIEVDVDDAAPARWDRHLLDELAGPAGLALSTVRLTVELRRSAHELAGVNAALASSADRLRTTRREQRQRFRREVETRVLPHVDQALAAARGEDPGSVDRAASTALEVLRQIARGVHPPRLIEDGVLASLESWTLRTGTPLQIDPAARSVALEPDAARCLYFCLVTVLDALADAGAQQLRVRQPAGAGGPSSGDEEFVTVEITTAADPGLRPDPASMQLARDRAEAFGGEVRYSVDTVRCSVPCAPSTAYTPTGAP